MQWWLGAARFFHGAGMMQAYALVLEFFPKQLNFTELCDSYSA